jgi:hypothetical protein
LTALVRCPRRVPALQSTQSAETMPVSIDTTQQRSQTAARQASHD